MPLNHDFARLLGIYKILLYGTRSVRWRQWLCVLALLVRFVTKKFIGDYDPNLEKMYTYQVSMESETANFEILDTAGYVQDVSDAAPILVFAGT